MAGCYRQTIEENERKKRFFFAYKRVRAMDPLFYLGSIVYGLWIKPESKQSRRIQGGYDL